MTIAVWRTRTRLSLTCSHSATATHQCARALSRALVCSASCTLHTAASEELANTARSSEELANTAHCSRQALAARQRNSADKKTDKDGSNEQRPTPAAERRGHQQVDAVAVQYLEAAIKKKEGKGGKGRGRGGGKGRRDEAKPEARVIGGLTVRAAKKKTDPKPQSATSAALERQRRLLKGVDVNALEAVDMSKDHAKLVEELLLSYGVVDDGSGSQQASRVPAPPPPPDTADDEAIARLLAAEYASPPVHAPPPPVRAAAKRAAAKVAR